MVRFILLLDSLSLATMFDLYPLRPFMERAESQKRLVVYITFKCDMSNV